MLKRADARRASLWELLVEELCEGGLRHRGPALSPGFLFVTIIDRLFRLRRRRIGPVSSLQPCLLDSRTISMISQDNKETLFTKSCLKVFRCSFFVWVSSISLVCTSLSFPYLLFFVEYVLFVYPYLGYRVVFSFYLYTLVIFWEIYYSPLRSLSFRLGL